MELKISKLLKEQWLKIIILLLLKIILVVAELGIAYILKIVLDFAGNSSTFELWQIIVFSVVISICFIGFSLLEARVENHFLRKIKDKIYNMLYEKIMIMDFSLYEKEDKAYYISIFQNDIPHIVTDNIAVTFDIFTNIISLVLSLAWLGIINIFVCLLILGLSILTSLIPLFFGKSLQMARQNYMDSEKIFISNLMDVFSFFLILRIYNFEKNAQDKCASKSSEMNKNETKMNIKNADARTMVFSSMLISQVLTFLVAAIFCQKGMMVVSDLIVCVQVSGTIVNAINGLLSGVSTRMTTKPIIDKINNILKTDNRVRELTISNEKPNISLKNVSFSYGDKQIVNNFSFDIPYGSKVLIKGGSGCGKSTLLKLILGLYDSYSGNIEISGKEVKDIDNSLYNSLVLVTQSTMLFSDSILNNITLGKPYDQNELDNIIDIVGLKALIDKKENGINEIISNNGENISGGEKQRINLARALLRKPSVLFLDEAFASLDAASEQSIREKLFKNDITIIEISHKVNISLDQFSLKINL